MNNRLTFFFTLLALMVLPATLPAATTRTWTGLGPNARWTTPQNWAGNVAPSAGDRLVFPSSAARRTNENDFAISTAFDSLSVTGSYTLEGLEIGLKSGLNVSASAAPGTEIHLPIALLASQTFAISNAIAQGVELMGPISLGVHALTFDCVGPQPTILRGVLSGSGSVSKKGSGVLDVFTTNAYSGQTLVQRGALLFQSNLALGSSASGTVVSNGASLMFSASQPDETLTEPLVLAGLLELNTLGKAIWSAPLVAQSDATVRILGVGLKQIDFSGPLSGSGNLLIDNQTPSTSNAPLVQLTAHSPITGSVVCDGLDVNVSGSISNASMTLRGSGNAPARLLGTGVVRALTAEAGTIISPAGDQGGDGSVSTLTVLQSLSLQGDARLQVNLNGTGVQDYDQLDVLGTVNLGLGTSQLDVRLGFFPPVGQVFAILDNDGVDAIVGTFAGKPEGAVFTVDGVRFRISYVGGTGNDIALTVLAPEELTWTGLAPGGNWGSPGNWSPVRVPHDGDRLIFPGGTPQRLMTNTILGLDLHSLVFPGTGANNNAFFIRGVGFGLTSGLAITNAATVEFQVPVSLKAPQSFVVRGSVGFGTSLALKGNVSVTGNSGLRIQTLLGKGDLLVNGVLTELTGTNAPAAGVSISNARLNYAAEQSAGTAARLTNGTLRLTEAHATIPGVLLANSALDVTAANIGSTGATLDCEGDLLFLGASRLDYIYDLSKQGRIDVSGEIHLNGASLVLSNISAAFGAPITLLANHGGAAVVGTFKSLPEGSEMFAANGTRVRLSYRGGESRRDVTLTPIAPITGVTRVWRGAGLTGNWSESANWIGGIIPSSGDDLEFPDAPRPFSINNLPANRIGQLLFTGHAGVNRELAPTGAIVELVGGIDYRDTGTLRFPVKATGPFTLAGVVQAQASQTFAVTNGGRVVVDGLTALPGARVTKTGEGELQLGFNGAFFGLPGAPLTQREGVLRIGDTDAPVEQLGGLLEVRKSAGDITLFGGAFQTAPVTTNVGVVLNRLDAGDAAAPVVVRPGGEGAVGLLTARQGITLNSNVTVRLDIATELSFGGINSATNDLIDLADSGDFQIDGARLDLNFLPTFKPNPTNLVLLVLSQNARTNLGNFAGLPHHGLLTNEFGVFRISYRDFLIPPPFNIFNNGPQQGMIVLERTIARPVMLSVTEGPGAFHTVKALGTPGVLYVIEASEDLKNWTTVGAETAGPGNGLFSFVDVSALEHRFYRAVLP